MTFPSVIFNLIQQVIGAETLIFADQNSPRPSLPYWTIKLSGYRDVGIDAYGQGPNLDGEIKVKGQREVTVQLQRIGPNSDYVAFEFRNNLSKISVLEQFQVSKVAIYDIGDVLNIPFKMDNAVFEPRASIDVFMRFGIELLDNVGIIDTVNVESNYVSDQFIGLENPNPELQQVNIIVL